MTQLQVTQDIEPLLQRFSRERTNVLPALVLIQSQRGYVSDEAIELIARHLRLTRDDVDGIASGYEEIHRAVRPAHVIRVCTGLSCWMSGAEEILSAVRKEVASMRRQDDVLVEEMPCAFSCACSPVIEIDGEYRGHMSSNQAAESVRQTSATRH